RFRLCEALRLPSLQPEGSEADDVIGTLARRATDADLDTVVVTSDKDMLQLVHTDASGQRPSVRVFSPTKNLLYDEAEVENYFGVPPEKVTDVVALMGDAIDNIPGAKGIGEKGARQLIAAYGSAEAAMERHAEVKQKKYREALRDQQDQIRLSKQLATLHTDLPVPFDLQQLARQEPDSEQLVALYSELGFTSLLKEQLPARPAQPGEVNYRELQSAEELREFLDGSFAAPLA
ncbi:MAG: DNA polymerase I, partial [Acidobacteria bacterium]|nr:DNA polymerase I [Acidobacteriota bacterium]